MTNKFVDGQTKKIIATDYQAKIHLSPLNKRIVLKNYQADNISSLVKKLIEIAKENEFTKIWIKAHQPDEQYFKKVGFEREAVIKNYYPQSDAISMAYYLSEDRKKLIAKEEEENIITELVDTEVKSQSSLAPDYKFKVVTEKDLEDLAKLYQQVFDSYPYPIDNKDYLKKMLEEDVIYGIVYDGNQAIAAASAETVPEYKNAEMTDFATLPDYRGQGLASYLLNRLEEELKARDYTCLYTIARAKIMGINKIFSQAGYEYTGTLVQNCDIAGGLEDMNLWCKVLNSSN